MFEGVKSKKTVILARTREDVGHLRPLLERLDRDGNDYVIIAEDVPAWLELRKSKTEFKFPADYLQFDACESIDKEALHFAKKWYSPIRNEIRFHGISLGEMMQFDFTKYAVDALSGIEIADSIIKREEPDLILLPPTLMPFLGNPRYESLRKAVVLRAALDGITVSKYGYSVSKEETKPSKELHPMFNKRTLQTLTWKLLLTMRYGINCKVNVVFMGPPERTVSPVMRSLMEMGVRRCIDVYAPSLFGSRIDLSMNVRRHSRVGPEEANLLWKRVMSVGGYIYHGVSLLEVLSERILYFLRHDLKWLSDLVLGTENFLALTKPDVVVFAGDIGTSDRTIAKVCNLNGNKTLALQCGVVGQSAMLWVLPAEAEKHAAWGTVTREWSISLGAPPESQVVTGNPAFDAYVSGHAEPALTSDVYLELGLSRTRPVILVATSWYDAVSAFVTPEQDYLFVLETLEALGSCNQLQLVYKLHPGGAYADLMGELIQQLEVKNVVVTLHHLPELLDICELVVTQTSTVGLEAMLFGKPVVTFNPRMRSERNPYFGSGSVVEVSTKQSLEKAVHSLLNQTDEETKRMREKQRLFVQSYAYLQDGKAAERTAKLIIDMGRQGGHPLRPT